MFGSLLWEQDVGSSNLSTPTNKIKYLLTVCAQHAGTF